MRAGPHAAPGVDAPAPAIRPARPEDAAACARILQGWLDATPWMPDLHTLAETERFVRDALIVRTTFVAEADGAIRGFLTLCEDQCGIAALYVAGGWRRRGVGSALLGAAEGRCRRLKLWTFQANEAARRFYARHGFREVRRTRGDNEEGLPDVEMTRERGP